VIWVTEKPGSFITEDDSFLEERYIRIALVILAERRINNMTELTLFSFSMKTFCLVSESRANFNVGNKSGYLNVNRNLPSLSPVPFSKFSRTSSGTPSSSFLVNQIPLFSSLRFFWNSIEI
jgi:hypothetical protein